MEGGDGALAAPVPPAGQLRESKPKAGRCPAGLVSLPVSDRDALEGDDPGTATGLAPEKGAALPVRFLRGKRREMRPALGVETLGVAERFPRRTPLFDLLPEPPHKGRLARWTAKVEGAVKPVSGPLGSPCAGEGAKSGCLLSYAWRPLASKPGARSTSARSPEFCSRPVPYLCWASGMVPGRPAQQPCSNSFANSWAAACRSGIGSRSRSRGGSGDDG